MIWFFWLVFTFMILTMIYDVAEMLSVKTRQDKRIGCFIALCVHGGFAWAAVVFAHSVAVCSS